MEARHSQGRLWIVDEWQQDIAWMITENERRGSIHYFVDSMGCGPRICLYNDPEEGKAALLEAFCAEEES